jgi:diaminohydroxyphosphoribosylaminopyrimidine deaminase/5-amino-6-(5-phosphoribosylamino)uracil reductase
MTLDGKTAAAGGDSRWISSPASRALVHEVRGRMDAIVAGIGTAMADDPLLTARPPGPRTARRIILDSGARLPLESRLVRTARDYPTIVAVGDAAPAEAVARLELAGCEVLPLSGDARWRIHALLDELGRRSITNVLVEGGGVVLGAFLDAGEVDELDVYVAPLIEGGDHSRTPARGQGRNLMAQAARLQNVRRTLVGEGDVRIQGELPSAWRTGLRTLIERGEPT